jgi:MOSC domain-containing protein YiiM
MPANISFVGHVVSVSKDDEHRFSKAPVESIRLIKDFGVEGDIHAGVTVQHRSRVAQDPTQPNLRQVHLIQREFFDVALSHGFELHSGDLGENILTSGVDLLELPQGARLHIGSEAVLYITGLRNPCNQINNFRNGLLKVSIGRGAGGEIIRKVGIMTVVERGGAVSAGDLIKASLPPLPHHRLERV